MAPTAPRNGAGFHPCQGLYYAPRHAKPKVGFIATHYNDDFSEAEPTTGLPILPTFGLRGEW